LLEFASVESNSDVPLFLLSNKEHTMATLESTINKVMKELKLDNLSPRQQKMLQEAMTDYGEAASSGDEAKRKEADKRLENTAEMCGADYDSIKNGLKKAGIK
jgi:hypothetical protein